MCRLMFPIVCLCAGYKSRSIDSRMCPKKCLKKCHIHTDTDVLESQNRAIQIDTERSGYCKCVLAEHRRSTAPQTILLLSPSGISICGRIYGTDVGLFRHLEIEKMESHPWSQGTSEDFCVCVINVRVPFTCSYGHYFWDERWDPCVGYKSTCCTPNYQ